ncbi:MAG: TrbC/VirB2 family protein [Clostridia bacterium]
MKKSKKIIFRVLPVVLLLVMVIFANATVFGFDQFKPDMQLNADTSTNVIGTVNRVWGIVLTVLQVAAIAAVVFAGVRYMFASANEKADIKKSMITLAVGAILVFGASTVVQFLIGSFKEIAG